jgi:hypothetical protein
MKLVASLVLGLGLFALVGCNIPGVDDVEKTENTTQLGPDMPAVQAETVIYNTGGGTVTYSGTAEE